MTVSHSDNKTVPIFQASSIRAMGPAAQGIAELLKNERYILIIDDREPEGTP